MRRAAHDSCWLCWHTSVLCYEENYWDNTLSCLPLVSSGKALVLFSFWWVLVLFYSPESLTLLGREELLLSQVAIWPKSEQVFSPEILLSPQ